MIGVLFFSPHPYRLQRAEFDKNCTYVLVGGIILMVQTQKRNWRLWLVLGLVLAVLLVLFAQKVTQLSLPGLGVSPKTAVVDPKCPTPQQKEVIERNMNQYGAGFSQGYDNTIYAKNLLAMAKTLGYPDPKLDDINDVLKFLRKALKINC